MKYALRLAIATSVLATAMPVMAQEKVISIQKPLDATLGKGVTVQQIVGRFINNLLGFVGVIALVMFVYGGFRYMTAGGNEESVTKAKNTLIWATLGLVAVFGAYTMVNFVITNLSKPPTPAAAPAPPPDVTRPADWTDENAP